jgi:hypothetical protein
MAPTEKHIHRTAQRLARLEQDRDGMYPWRVEAISGLPACTSAFDWAYGDLTLHRSAAPHHARVLALGELIWLGKYEEVGPSYASDGSIASVTAALVACLPLERKVALITTKLREGPWLFCKGSDEWCLSHVVGAALYRELRSDVAMKLAGLPRMRRLVEFLETKQHICDQRSAQVELYAVVIRLQHACFNWGRGGKPLRATFTSLKTRLESCLFRSSQELRTTIKFKASCLARAADCLELAHIMPSDSRFFPDICSMFSASYARSWQVQIESAPPEQIHLNSELE